MTRYCRILAVFAATALLCGSAVAQQQEQVPANVQVAVDGAPVSFTDPVLMIDMQLPLLPADTFLQALGATSSWNAGAQRLDVEHGDTSVQMWVGRDWVTVDGTRETVEFGLQTLSGLPYVPGPATAALLGFDVQWSAETLALNIMTPTTMPEGPTVTATLLELRRQSILVRVDESGQVGEVPLSADTVVQRGAVDEDATRAQLSDLQPGDQLEIVFDEQNTGIGVGATYAQSVGTIASIQGNELTLQDGQTFSLGEEIEAYGADGNPLHLLAAVGQGAILTMNPAHNAVWRIVAREPGTTSPPATDTPTIAAFMVPRYDQALGEGGVLSIRIVGTSAASATVTLGSSGQAVTLAEGQPGVYAGNMTIPAGLLIPDETLTAQLAAGGRSSAQVSSNRAVMVDSVPPVLHEELPNDRTQQALPTTNVRMRFHDGDGIGVDQATATLSLDGTDVTGDADVAANQIRHVPPGTLAVGRHTATASVADALGNAASRTWTFTVMAPEHGITEISHDAEEPLMVGETVTVTIQVAAAGQQASFDIEGVVQDVPMAQVGQTNRYRGAYTVRQDDTAREVEVTARFAAADGTTYEATAPTTLSTEAEDVEFAVTTPQPDVRTGRRVTPAGTAPAGSSVRWTISYQEFILTGDVATGTVEADADGNWQAEREVDLKLMLVGMADQYTLKAELLDQAGAVLDTKTVQFKARD